MDESTPEVPPTPPATPAPKRLQGIVGSEPIVAWTRGWVSRETRAHRLFAARTYDFAALTEHSLVLVSTGFFTRRPRHCVYSGELARIAISDDPVPRGRRIRISAPDARTLRLELRSEPSATRFADAVVARGRADRS